MSKPQLEEEEYIIASDDASLHNELISRKGTLYLTNSRLLFLDKSSWRKTKNLRIAHDQIDLLDATKSGFILHTENELYHFRGTGSKRIYDRLQTRRKTLSLGAIQEDISEQQLREIIYLQGDITLFQKNTGIAAQFFFTSRGLHITTTASLFRRAHSIKVSFEDIEKFQFTLRNKSLNIHIKDDPSPIVISGDLAPNLYLSLVEKRDGGFAENWNNLEVGYTKGLLKIKGLLCITKKSVAFCPTEAIDIIAQAKELEIPIKDIYRIEKKGWPEKKLTLLFDTHQVSFSTADSEKDFAFFIQTFLKNAPKNPWKVQNRSELLQANSLFGIQLKPNAEKILLISWCTQIVSTEEIFVGWLMLTNLQIRFVSIHTKQNWSAPVEQIQRFSEDETDIHIQYKDAEYTFSCQGGNKFTKIFWKRLELLKPPSYLSGARSGQDLDKIIGPSPIALIFRKNVLIHHIFNVMINKSKQTVSIQCEKLNYSDIKKGELIEIEIPKVIGRFRFFSYVKGNYLTKKSMEERYELVLIRPDNLYVYNQRKSFRVPIKQQCTISLHRTDTPEHHVLFEDLPRKKEIQGILFDISLGGCGILIDENISELRAETLLFRFSITIFDSQIFLQGILRHIAYKEDSGLWSHGIKFVHLPSNVENMIFQDVLRLERDMLQKEKGES